MNLLKTLSIFFRKLIIWLVFRVFAFLMIISITLVCFFYFQLPSMEDLLDARDQGSVTLLDKNGEIFAWRGKQFEGL